MTQSTLMLDDRQRAKRNAILNIALDVFSQHGYLGTSTDVLAREASVSKQTLYKLFGDKDGVFTALIQRACDEVVDPFVPLVEQMHQVASAETAVHSLAEQFAYAIMNERIQKLRRLVIADATRFPDLAALYWDSGFGRMLVSLSECFTVLDQRGLLCIDDSDLAAQHFAGLLLWIPSNRAMFNVNDPAIDSKELDHVVHVGARAFVRAYSP